MSENTETKKSRKKAPKRVGKVVDCLKLNVRKQASIESPVVTIIETGSSVTIDAEKTDAGFYKVTTASGEKGYCMMRYVRVE